MGVRGFLVLVVLVGAGCGNDDRPEFTSVLVPPDTTDTRGPYALEAYVQGSRDIIEVAVIVAAAASDPGTEMRAHLVDGASGDAERWIVELPGRPAGSTYYLYWVAVDIGGRKTSYPAGAPEERLSFSVLPTP